MKRKYIRKRFILGICAISLAFGMLAVDIIVLIDKLPKSMLLITIPTILILGKISKEMDHATLMIEFSQILNEVFGDDAFDEEDLDI